MTLKIRIHLITPLALVLTVGMEMMTMTVPAPTASRRVVKGLDVTLKLGFALTMIVRRLDVAVMTVSPPGNVRVMTVKPLDATALIAMARVSVLASTAFPWDVSVLFATLKPECAPDMTVTRSLAQAQTVGMVFAQVKAASLKIMTVKPKMQMCVRNMCIPTRILLPLH